MDLHSIPVEANAGTATATKKKSRRFRIISALLSSVIPGAGQFLLGRRKIALVFFSLFLLAGVLFWPIRIPTWFWGLQIVITASFVLFVVTGWHALCCKNELVGKGSYWWLFLIVPIALASAVGHGNLWMLAAGFKPFEIPSTAMEPTLYPTDRVIVDLRRYHKLEPRRGDLAVYKRDGIFYIKRVIATEGNTIQGKDGQILVDGNLLYEPYTQHVGIVNFPWLNDFGPEKIPTRKFFVLGDNRNVSVDSRMPDHGLVSEEELIGQAIYIARSSKPGRESIDLRPQNTQP